MTQTKNTKPKIICTLGTTTDSKEVLEEMVKHGMQCVRMNTAYATIEEYQQRLAMVREVDPDIEVMMDIKGPQVRLFADASYPINEGDVLITGFKDEPLRFSKNFYNDIAVGDTLLIDNGTIETIISKKQDNKLHLRVIDPGEESMLCKQRGVNIPGKYLNVSRLSRKDLEVIDFAVQNNVDYIALSFTRNFEDVNNLYEVIEESKKELGNTKEIGIELKIEDKFGMENLSDILTKCYEKQIKVSVMVARGDLFVELPKEELPYAQERIVHICKEYQVPVTIGTGVLESMQYEFEPTRAEVIDVYQGLQQGVDAFMLSGETSNGHDPAAVVAMLENVIERYKSDTYDG